MSVAKKLFDFCQKNYSCECQNLNLLSDKIDFFETDIKAIDFDKLTQIIFGISTDIIKPSSVDAIIFNNKIIFIEFKSLVKTIEQNQDDKKNIEKWDFDKKLEDSNFTLKHISISKKLNLSKVDSKKLRELEKPYFVVIDSELENNGIQNFLTSLEYLSNPLRLKTDKAVKELESHIELMVSTPYLISVNKINNILNVDNLCNLD